MSAGSKADSPHITHLITSGSSAKEFIKWENSGVRLLSIGQQQLFFVVSGGTHKRFSSFGFDGTSYRKRIQQWTKALAARVGWIE